MHETALVRDVVRRIEDLVRSTGAGRVIRATIWLGAFSHMSAAHFRAHYAIEAGDGPAAEADLEIEVSADRDDPNVAAVLLVSVELDA
jgi:Zn finger protein HypA/HybF involved in hydrogenase expression